MRTPRYSLHRWLTILVGGLLLLVVLSSGLALAGRVNQFQVVMLISGLALFFVAVVLIRRTLTVPLQRMATRMEEMRQTGRLMKVPVSDANELGLVAEGFNQLAQQVEEQKQHLRERIVELQRTNTELDQLANLKDDFLTTVNHQLRTPLTAIVAGVELLCEGAAGSVNADQQRLLSTMQQNALQLDHLIEEVLDLSLVKSGRRLLKRHPADLGVVLRHAQMAWQAAAQSRTIHVVCPTLPMVYMDSEAISEVMDHLLRNALRHTPEQGQITIEAWVDETFVRVSVSDQGPGMSAQQIAQLFQPFVHVHTPDSPGSQGGGLGLAFCQQIIQRHHGTIHAESVMGQGLTLIFALPIASARFLLAEACRIAREEAKQEHGAFALLVVTPAAEDALATQHGEDTLRQAENIFRQSTHHGDQFVWVDPHTLVIVAVTNPAGLQALMTRLRGLIETLRLRVCLVSVLSPHDGHTPEQLLEAARARSCQIHVHAAYANEDVTDGVTSDPSGNAPALTRAPQTRKGKPT